MKSNAVLLSAGSIHKGQDRDIRAHHDRRFRLHEVSVDVI